MTRSLAQSIEEALAERSAPPSAPDAIPAMDFRWDGHAMVPRRLGLARRYYRDAEDYRLALERDRSQKSHRHEFAWLNQAWATLPEALAADYPTPEHLRKRALILAGFFHETVIDAGSRAAALRVATALRARDQFAHIAVRSGFVIIRDAKSQSRRAMQDDEFQASKSAIMAVIAEMLGAAE
jgi:hypothetical protein